MNLFAHITSKFTHGGNMQVQSDKPIHCYIQLEPTMLTEFNSSDSDRIMIFDEYNNHYINHIGRFGKTIKLNFSVGEELKGKKLIVIYATLLNKKILEYASCTIDVPTFDISDKSCPLCLDDLDYENASSIYVSKCAHSFHYRCMKLYWDSISKVNKLKQNLLCPICRAQIDSFH